MKNKKFNEYKKLKGILEGYYYKGYPLHLVLGSYLGIMTWKPTLKQFISYILLNAKKLKIFSSGKNIYTYSTEREDYLELIRAYFPNAQPQNVRIDNGVKDRIQGFFFSILVLFRSFVFTIGIRCALKEKIKLIIALSIAFKIIDELEKFEIECEKYIALNSSYLVESFISYYFRKRGVKTYSLQHGMYFNYINDIPFDVINFENVCAEKLLVWGPFSLKEIESVVPESSKCVLFGYPDSRYPTKIPEKSVDEILVLLPRDIYLEDVKVLLLYLKNYPFKYIVRPHPSIYESVSNIIFKNGRFSLDTNPTMSSTLSMCLYTAVITFNSTAVFEASLYKQNVYIFKSSNSEFLNPGFNEFSIYDDLALVLNNNKSLTSDEFFAPNSSL